MAWQVGFLGFFRVRVPAPTHKIPPRPTLCGGFLPTFTHSAHWIAHPGFRQAIAEFLERETPAVRAYAQDLLGHSPYRAEEPFDAPAVAGS